MIYRVLIACVLILFAAAYASGQPFTNLDFEQAQVVLQDPTFGWLDWSLAAPGWSHSTGNDTQIVYYGNTHVGLTQWFLLVDGISNSTMPLAGQYSLMFQSGYSLPWGDEWVNAFIAQSGDVPAGARSVRFLATGDLSILINDIAIPVFSLGTPNAYAADISSYAGTNVELKIRNNGTYWGSQATMVDGIEFSPVPVPEPSGFLALGLGVSAILRLRRGRRRRC